jgi:hypothetical protein
MSHSSHLWVLPVLAQPVEHGLAARGRVRDVVAGSEHKLTIPAGTAQHIQQRTTVLSSCTTELPFQACKVQWYMPNSWWSALVIGMTCLPFEQSHISDHQGRRGAPHDTRTLQLPESAVHDADSTDPSLPPTPVVKLPEVCSYCGASPVVAARHLSKHSGSRHAVLVLQCIRACNTYVTYLEHLNRT